MDNIISSRPNVSLLSWRPLTYSKKARPPLNVVKATGFIFNGPNIHQEHYPHKMI